MAIRSPQAADLAGAAAHAPSSTLMRSIRSRLERWLEQRQIADELHLLSHRELADLGLSQSDIPAVVRGTYRRN